ncbi:hypothetical protein CARUB_v10015759mg [Capsella rubella]|uniref:F-box domain-containing protein n=1 Tax=Capsella rubella TaxID=81985 RepID=R0I3H3_9BRAS|nr:putative F-box/LRR-repeat protein At5g54820 [Capsella rubella]EOA32480.1 hypothetical protein CARUB_v10015759mg [Capsella rubella]
MVSTQTPDLSSLLHDSLLIVILSMLPFKELVRKSFVSRRWRNLCRQTTSLVFKESDFVTPSVPGRELEEPTSCDEDDDRAFVAGVMLHWVSKFTGTAIQNFEIHLSQPLHFEGELMSLIEFATSRHVKNLVLNFSADEPIQQPLSDYLRIRRLRHAIRADYILRCKKKELDVSRLFFNLIYVKSLTVCSFLLEAIEDCDHPLALHDPMETQHLVMITNLHPKELGGISIFLSSCPKLESLTFDSVTKCRLRLVPSPTTKDPKTYWLTSKAYKCLEKTLKVVKVKNFTGGFNELQVLQYLIRTGCVLERVDLYEAKGLNPNQKSLVMAGVEKAQKNFKKASKNLRITLNSA